MSMDINAWIIRNCKFAQVQGWLRQRLMALRPQIATMAQQAYDSWEQDEDGMNDELGAGGICDEIAEGIANLVMQDMGDLVEVEDYGFEGDDHASKIVSALSMDTGQQTGERYLVDIPYSYYETGGGYSWKKIPNVVFDQNMVQIVKI